jgi:hypothetical protein
MLSVEHIASGCVSSWTSRKDEEYVLRHLVSYSMDRRKKEDQTGPAPPGGKLNVGQVAQFPEGEKINGWPALA